MNSKLKESSLIRFYNSDESDLFGKTEPLARFVDSLHENRMYCYRVNTLERRGTEARVEWAGEERWVIDCASNDYLQMNAHPEVRDAVREAVTTHGVGAQGASMLNGNTPIHLQLEKELASFLGQEAVLLSASGYSSQLAATQGLLRSTDVVFCDHHCHSSLVEGMQLSNATVFRYPHLDTAGLEELLRQYRSRGHAALIVTDGVFSAEGSVANIPRLVDLSRQFDARLLVDDAHGVGTINGGKGCAFWPGIDLVTGTLSKALGSAGGFIAGPHQVIEYLRLFGTANCSTTNLSVVNAAASLAALRILQRDGSLVERLTNNVSWFRRRLFDLGIESSDSISPIMSLVCGKDSTTFKAWRMLLEAGILGHALPFPIVQQGTSRIRIRLNTAFDESTLEDVATKVATITPLLAKKEQRASYRRKEVWSDVSEPQIVETRHGPLVLRETGSGHPVLLLHPLLFCSDVYSEVIDELNGYHVMTVDFPGHGSAPPIDRELSLDDLAEALLDVIAEKVPGEQPFSLVGTSMGGMIALRVAARRAERVARLVLIGASADPEEGRARNMFRSFTDVASAIGSQAVADDIMMSMFSSHFMNEHPLSKRFWRERLTSRNAAAVRACTHAVLERGSMVQDLKKIDTHTVVLVGDEDIAEPIPHSRTLADLIPNAELRIVEHCGHVVPVECPDVVLNALKSSTC